VLLAEPPSAFEKGRSSKVNWEASFNKTFLYPAPQSNCLISHIHRLCFPPFSVETPGPTWDQWGCWGTSMGLPGCKLGQKGKACFSVLAGLSTGCRDAMCSQINYVFPSLLFDTFLRWEVYIIPLST